MAVDYGQFETFLSSPLASLAFDIAPTLKLNRKALAGSLDLGFNDEDDAINYFRGCIGDKAVLVLAGELRGLNDGNNPYVVFNTPQLKVEGKSLKTNGFKNMKSRLWGEHDNNKRVERFLRAFVKRLKKGDSIAHALNLAKFSMKYYGVGIESYRDNNYLFPIRNELTSGRFTNSDPKIVTPDIKALLPLFAQCLMTYAEKSYDRFFPQEYAEDMAASGREGPMQLTSPENLETFNVNVDVKSSKLPLFLGAGAVGVLGLYLVTRK